MSEAEHDPAAEFALGLTPAGERDARTAQLRADPAFAEAVRAWQARLAGLDAEFVPVTPPPGPLARAEVRLFGQAPRRRRMPGGWFGWIGAGAMPVAAALFAVWLWPAAPRSIAELNGPELAVSVLASGERLLFRSPSQAPEGRDFQLWIIRDGTPRPIGLLTAPETSLVAALQPGDVLAVSLEPRGGSPSGLPTGPVLATAAIPAEQAPRPAPG